MKRETDGLAPETQIWGALLSFCSVTKQSGARGGERWVTQSVLAETLVRLSGTLPCQTSTQNVFDPLQHALSALRELSVADSMLSCKALEKFLSSSWAADTFREAPLYCARWSVALWEWKGSQWELISWLKDVSLTFKPSISFVMWKILVQIDCCFRKCVCLAIMFINSSHATFQRCLDENQHGVSNVMHLCVCVVVITSIVWWVKIHFFTTKLLSVCVCLCISLC